MLLLARRICRGLGLTAHPVIRQGSPTVEVRFDDGSAVGIRPDIVLLERRGKLDSSLAKTFAGALARAKQWVISRHDTALPPPRPGEPGTPLAGTLAALRTHMGARLRGRQPVHLTADLCLRQHAVTLWHELVQHGPDVEEQTSPVLILTPRCLRAVLAREPGGAERLKALTTRNPEVTVAAFLPPNGVPRVLSMDRLNGIIRSRLKKTRLASEVASGCQSDDSGLDFPAPA
ncbi:hypothetical protein [Paracoccus beibuensis]|uniref:hypothetical protein n=1 Tax=Paracoccus beibuensis TaxID=547602 RepID=UPI00223F248E|nr:hypothetical protein [Paracoccus beibuensis]